MGEMKAIKGFIILEESTRLSVSKIITYYETLSKEVRIIYSMPNDKTSYYTSKYTIEEIDEAIIKAQL